MLKKKIHFAPHGSPPKGEKSTHGCTRLLFGDGRGLANRWSSIAAKKEEERASENRSEFCIRASFATTLPFFRRGFCIRRRARLFYHPRSSSRLVALRLSYRYGYDIRRTGQTTNGYSIETTPRRFLRETLSRPTVVAATITYGSRARAGNARIFRPRERYASRASFSRRGDALPSRDSFLRASWKLR